MPVSRLCLNLMLTPASGESSISMGKPLPTASGADWTRLLKDPEVASHLGELLQAYREAPADKRDQVLVDMMRRIKGVDAPQQTAASGDFSPFATESKTVPPFEPDIFTPSWGQDRRQYPRMKCFVAVEMRIAGTEALVWGNLSNTSIGGCFVETATPIPNGTKIEIGLWVASGKIWVKGLILTGVVTQSKSSFGVRIKFSTMETEERESLRQFLRFVENTTKTYHQQQGYLAQLK